MAIGPAGGPPLTSLRGLFAPTGVALVGASDDLSKFGGRCLDRLVRFGYEGKIYPVNPARATVQGLKCYPSVLDVPDPIDLVGAVVRAEIIPDVLAECEQRKVPFVIVFSGGFGEAGTTRGRELQKLITEFAHRTGIRVMGPNTNGLINFVDDFALTSTATLLGPRRPAGHIGIVSHSGGLGQVNTMWRAQQLGLGVSCEVSCGNTADLDELDFMQYLVEDPATQVILALLERVSSGDKLARIARAARDVEKPIVVLKIGRTAEGSRAAASHTGAVTGTDDVYDAAFRQFGMLRVDDVNELYETGMMLQTRRWPRGTGVAAASISGGNVALFSDLGSWSGLRFPRLGKATREGLADVLPGLGKVENPLDLTVDANAERPIFHQALRILSEDDAVSVVVPILTMAQPRFVDDIKRVYDESNVPMAVLWTGGCVDPGISQSDLVDAGVPVYLNTLACIKAVKAATKYGEFLRSTPPMRRPIPAALEEAIAVTRSTLEMGTPLTERASKEILARFGFPVTRERLARRPDEAVQIARAIGYPVALKIESPDILHKSEASAIRLGLTTDGEVRRAFHDILRAATQYDASARCDGVLVQEMVADGLEVLLGVQRDPTFGPVVVVGLGGIHVEILDDVVRRLPPLDQAAADVMIQDLRAHKLFDGVRGAPPRDVDALAEMIVRLSDLAEILQGDLEELDINPVMVFERGRGAVVVDALIVPASAPA
jgi:acyl-CoA synthetase (NDP forming)